jgi:eukaryotic-like serine/threonine-protein kinase
MNTDPTLPIKHRFGLFEVVPGAGGLMRQGRRVKIQEQPFRLLVALLEHPGEIVSRDVLRQRLWPGDTFVEFDQGLGTAVARLRQALDDDANNPRFVETVPKRGFRFIAPVQTTLEPPGESKNPASQLPSGAQQTAPPDETPSEKKDLTATDSSRPRTRHYLPVAAALSLAVLLGAYIYHRHTAFRFTPQGTIVLADFFNTTGEAVFDDALRQALEIGLRQSAMVNLLSERRSAVIMKQMGYSPEARMAGRTAIEVCRRSGGLVTVQGSISSLGTTYLVGLAAIRCDNGKLIANEQAESSKKEEVIDALGRVTSQLRARLGESLPSIQKYNAPLEQATTTSLDALNAYSTALLTWDRKGDRASLPFFEKAIELDPNFAMAYGALAAIYHNLGETELARQSTVKAYELRGRVTESERTAIEARYYIYVTGELEKADQVYEQAAQDYPNSAGSLNHLANTDEKIARHERSAEALRKALLLDPSRATTYANLAQTLLRLNRVEEAVSVLQEADKRNLKTDFLLQTNYWVAFIHGDRGQMDQDLQKAADIPGAQSLLSCEQANTEAYWGHYDKAAKLSRLAADLMKKEGNSESAANCLTQAALREAEVGSSATARALVLQARALNNSKIIMTLAALVAARDGDQAQTLAVTSDLDREFPAGTLVQKYWLPLIRGQLELRLGHPDRAIGLLAAAEPLESAVADGFYVSTLYPAYVRGQAYLAANNGGKASLEFQKLIDNPGMVLNFPLGALARLGRARAYYQMKENVRAREAYQDFFALWKDADPNIPILLTARSEYAKIALANR